MLDKGFVGGQGLAPKALQIRSHDRQTVWIDAIDAPRANRPVNYEPGILEHPQMLRDRRPADWQLASKLDDRAGPIDEQLKYRLTCGIAKRKPCIRLVSQH